MIDPEHTPGDDDRFNAGVAENAGETAEAIEDVEELEFIKEWISKRDKGGFRRWTWK